jgi:hypothetical protein
MVEDDCLFTLSFDDVDEPGAQWFSTRSILLARLVSPPYCTGWVLLLGPAEKPER